VKRCSFSLPHKLSSHVKWQRAVGFNPGAEVQAYSAFDENNIYVAVTIRE